MWEKKTFILGFGNSDRASSFALNLLESGNFIPANNKNPIDASSNMSCDNPAITSNLPYIHIPILPNKKNFSTSESFLTTDISVTLTPDIPTTTTAPTLSTKSMPIPKLPIPPSYSTSYPILASALERRDTDTLSIPPVPPTPITSYSLPTSMFDKKQQQLQGIPSTSTYPYPTGPSFSYAPPPSSQYRPILALPQPPSQYFPPPNVSTTPLLGNGNTSNYYTELFQNPEAASCSWNAPGKMLSYVGR